MHVTKQPLLLIHLLVLPVFGSTPTQFDQPLIGHTPISTPKALMFELPGEGGNSIPPVTLAYGALTVLMTLLCASNALSPMSIYFSVPLILAGQVQRIFTHFFFFGASLTIDFALHVFVFVRYSRELEERTFLNRSIEYLWMLVFGATCLTAIAIYFRFMIMSSALVFMVTYVWARANPDLPVAPMLGIVRFRAPYLPWVLLAFSFFSGNDIIADLLGLVVGHLYYYLEFVYPRMRPDRKRFLATPDWFYYLCLRRPPSAAERRAGDIARGMPVPALPPAPAGFAIGAGTGAGAGAGAGAENRAVDAGEVEAVRAATVPQADPDVTRRMREIAERQRLQRERTAAAITAEEAGFAAPVLADTVPAADSPAVSVATTPAPAPGIGETADAGATAIHEADELALPVEPSPEELRQIRLRARAAAMGSPNVRFYG